MSVLVEFFLKEQQKSLLVLPRKGLEPPRLAAPDPKSGVSAISPPGQM